MRYIGIDPGVSGGIAVIEAGRPPAAVKMPDTDTDLLKALDELAQDEDAIALLERVSASPQMGVVSAFTFGRSYGKLEMALVALEIPFDYVRPQKWQQAMGCLSGGDKNVTKRRAQQLFPHLTITHAIADALLLAEYCRRLESGRYGKEESRDAQGRTEARGETEGQGGQAVAHQKPARAATAIAGTPRNGAGPQRAPRSPV